MLCVTVVFRFGYLNLVEEIAWCFILRQTLYLNYLRYLIFFVMLSR